MATVTMETKQSKILELSNLISQYDNGERENINSSEYPQWQVISDMLKRAEISEDIYSDFLQNPTHYNVIDNEIVYNENWQAEAEQKEQERIAMLHITKQDFFEYVVKPHGISYPQLLQIVNSDEDLAASWDLCNHVYRGNEKLNQYIFHQIPNITEEQLTAIFEQHGVSEE